jgi:putative ABC transport system permease protein
MQINELIKSAVRSLLANKKRSFLTMIGIVIGIASVITIMSIGNGVQRKVTESLSANNGGQMKVTISYMSYDDKGAGITPTDIALIESSTIGQTISNLKVSSLDHGVGMATLAIGDDRPSEMPVSAVESVPFADIAYGRNFNAAEIRTGEQVALVEKMFAKESFGRASSAVGGRVRVGNASYRIIGVHEMPGMSLMNGASGASEPVVLPKETYLNTFESSNGMTLTFNIPKGEDPKKYGKAVQKILTRDGEHRANGEYYFAEMSEIVKKISAVLNMMTYFVAAVAAISLFIAGIGVMNMMYISVSERTQEIGIRLAVGATERSVRWQFLIESMILSVVAGVLGLATGFLLGKGVSAFLPYGISAYVDWANIALALGVSTAVGIVFGWLPAQQAAKKNLIDILR